MDRYDDQFEYWTERAAEHGDYSYDAISNDPGYLFAYELAFGEQRSDDEIQDEIDAGEIDEITGDMVVDDWHDFAVFLAEFLGYDHDEISEYFKEFGFDS